MNSRLEEYDLARQEIEERTAAPMLNFIWGLKFIVNTIFIMLLTYVLILGGSKDLLKDISIWVSALFLIGIEMIGIMGYFKRKTWSKYILAFYAAVSFCIIPIGTILSIIHFRNINKVRF